MTDRTWLAVYVALTRVFIASQPYDAKGAFLLLHAIDATLHPNGPGITHTAARFHIVAAFDATIRHQDAARRSMIRIVADLERLEARHRPPC